MKQKNIDKLTLLKQKLVQTEIVCRDCIRTPLSVYLEELELKLDELQTHINTVKGVLEEELS